MTDPSLISSHLQQLRLPSAKLEYERQLRDPSSTGMTFDDRLELIISREVSERASRRSQRRIREANFKVHAVPEEIDSSAARGISPAELSHLLSLSWLRSHHNVLVTGATGVGKTYLICALGTACARAFGTVRYFKCSGLLERIGTSRLDGTYRSFASKLAQVDLLIIDDWGLSPISVNSSRELLDILDDRSQVSSTIISSQLPLKEWYEVMEEQTVADAVLDRLVHNAIKIDLKGESMRKLKARESPKKSIEV